MESSAKSAHTYQAVVITLLAVSAAGCSDSGPGTNPDTTTPAAITVASGNNQTADVGAELGAPLVVRVSNAGNAPLQGVTVDWSVLSGGGALGSASSTTNAQGQAQTTYTVGAAAGANQVRAAVRGSAGLTTAFTVTAVDNTPASMLKVSGDNQSATVSQSLANPLVVRVRNAGGQGLQGVAVQWSVVQGGGTLGATSTTTNAQGEASTTYTVGSATGTNEVRASVQTALAINASFTATANAPSTGVTVGVANFQFTPPSATVAAGGTVTWNFNQGIHNVTWVAGGFTNSGDLGSGTYQVTFPAAGTYSYYCSIHGSPGSGMAGSITVQ
jgi:plastocyanin